MNHYINAANFNKSIVIALNNSFDKAAAVKHVKDHISHTKPAVLYIKKSNSMVVFYESLDNNRQKYLSKKSPELYDLARRRYLLLLLQILQLTYPASSKLSNRRRKLIVKLQTLIETYDKANLDIARIVLTGNQYKWFFGNYNMKNPPDDIVHKTGNNTAVRSKSERDIGNGLEDLAIIYHYEEKQSVYVLPLVQKLEMALRSNGELQGNICYEKDGICHWRVPVYLRWMNAPGSIWKTYNFRTGKLTIYNDFKIMLADSDIIVWEHEGLCDDFIYRCNASERVFVLSYTSTVPLKNLIFSYESDVSNKQVLKKIIEDRILSRLWF